MCKTPGQPVWAFHFCVTDEPGPVEANAHVRSCASTWRPTTSTLKRALRAARIFLCKSPTTLSRTRDFADTIRDFLPGVRRARFTLQRRIYSMNLKIKRGLGWAAFAAALASAPSHATSVRQMSIVDLLDHSQSIVAGRVEKVSDGFDAKGVPYTEVTLKVTDTIRGAKGKTRTRSANSASTSRARCPTAACTWRSPLGLADLAHGRSRRSCSCTRKRRSPDCRPPSAWATER